MKTSTIFTAIFAILCLIPLDLNAATTRPNVLFIAVDDMNDWIGCMGSKPQAITPNLDKLASRGVCFTNAHTAGVYCAPSRASIFSGQYASTTGCYDSFAYFAHRPNIESLQTSFSKAGYTTLGAGKLYHHREGSIDQRGWTHFFLRNQWQRENGWPLASWDSDTPFPEPFPSSRYNQNRKVTPGLFLEWAAIPDDQEEQMADTIRANWAVDQIKQKHDKPFFLACGFYAPHYPNYCPKKYFDLYDINQIQTPTVNEDDLDDLPRKVRKQRQNRKKQHYEKLVAMGAWPEAIHGYLSCISYADAMIGRILDALEQSPYADNTIVILWSDHGYHLGEKGQWGKHTLWERTSNVPFIWAGPGVKQGNNSDISTSLIDIYPTLVEMCNLGQPHQKLDGVSLASTLKDPDAAEDRDIFLPYVTPGEYAVINRDWRYIHYDDDNEELYNLKTDPHEWNNLANDSQYAEIISQLKQASPKTFADPVPKYNFNKDLVIEGETFRWEVGKGNHVRGEYLPHKKAKK